MISIISPSKTMKKSIEWRNTISCDDVTYPALYKQSNIILKELKGYLAEEIAGLMKINERLAQLNYARFQRIKPMTGEEKGICHKKSPAIFSYDGIQYKSMMLSEMSRENMEFMNSHIRILSGFYGILRPLDMIDEYRLEMQTKIKINGCCGLYSFWKDTIAEEIIKTSETKGVVLNLASKEYSKAVEKYILSSGIRFVDCIFKVEKNGKLKVESTASKKGRGAMVRFISENHIDDIDGIKNFKEDGFEYSEENSSENEIVFIKR